MLRRESDGRETLEQEHVELIEADLISK